MLKDGLHRPGKDIVSLLSEAGCDTQAGTKHQLSDYPHGGQYEFGASFLLPTTSLRAWWGRVLSIAWYPTPPIIVNQFIGARYGTTASSS